MLKIKVSSNGRDLNIVYGARDLLGIVVQPLDLHLVNVGSTPTGPTHGEGRLEPHPEDVSKSTPRFRKSPRSGLNLEGRLSDPQICSWSSGPAWYSGSAA